MNMVQTFLLLVSAGIAISVNYTQEALQNKPFTDHGVDIGNCSSVRFKVKSCGPVSMFFALTESKNSDFFTLRLMPRPGSTTISSALLYYSCPNCASDNIDFKVDMCTTSVPLWASWSAGYMSAGFGSIIGLTVDLTLQTPPVNSIVFGGMKNTVFVEMEIVDDPCMFPPTTPPMTTTPTPTPTEVPKTEETIGFNVSSSISPFNNSVQNTSASHNPDLESGSAKQSEASMHMLVGVLFLVLAKAM